MQIIESFEICFNYSFLIFFRRDKYISCILFTCGKFWNKNICIRSYPSRQKTKYFILLEYLSPYVVSAQSNDRLQRIDRRFFHLPGLYRVPATVSGAASRYALAKNTSDRWRPGPGTGVSEKMMKKRKKRGGRRQVAEKRDASRCRRWEREREEAKSRRVTLTEERRGPEGLHVDRTRTNERGPSALSWTREEWRRTKRDRNARTCKKGQQVDGG